MLFKRTVKAVSAAALWMVALLGAHSAMATVMLNAPQTATSNMPAVFSAEALNAPTGGVHAITLDGAAADTTALTATTMLGTLAGVINRSNDIYIRFDVGGVLRLTTAPAGTNFSVGGTDRDTNQTTPGISGATRDQHLIYIQPTVAAAASADLVSLNLLGAVGLAGIGDGTLRVRVYDDIRDAVSASGDTLLDQSAVLVRAARSIGIRAMPQTSTATVVSGFTQFEGAAGVDDMQAIAAMSISIGCHNGPNGAKLQGDSTLATDTATPGDCGTDVSDPPAEVTGAAIPKIVPFLSSVNVNAAASGVQVSGDSGFAFAKATSFSMMADCSGGSGANFPKLADGKNNLAGPASGGVMVGATYVCVTVAPTNMERIEPGTYEATVALAATDANRSFPPMGVSDVTVGTIRHDGTSVSIPYVTSYDMYTQRLIIVNRNKQDVSYRLMFHTEGDGTADPMYVDGMAMGGMTTVMKVADIVTLMNPTRASATLDIVSSPRMVDVSTTMVNKMDQSTDTVVLHLGKRDTNNM